MAQCSLKPCKNRKSRGNGISFFRLPSIISHQGEQTEELTKQRRAAWLKNIGRTFKESSLVNVRVCSDHFISGKPATLYDTANPDWSPKLKLGSCTFNEEILKQSMKRASRRKKRSRAKRLDTLKPTSTSSTDDKHELQAAEASSLADDLSQMFDDIKEKLTSNPELFNDPVKTMLTSYKNINSDSSLASAMIMFGRYTGVSLARHKLASKKGLALPFPSCSNGSSGVQPPAVSRKKLQLGGKKRLLSGHPTKQARVVEHGYARGSSLTFNISELDDV